MTIKPNEEKDLKTNKEEKNLVLIVENANTRLKQILADCFMLSLPKQSAKAMVDTLITETTKLLKEAGASTDLIDGTILGIKQTFLRQWRETIILLKKYAKKDDVGILAQTLARMMSSDDVVMKVEPVGGLMIGDVGNNELAIAVGGVTNLRDFMTGIGSVEGNEMVNLENAASQRFVDYADKVEDAIVQITEKIADGTLCEYGTRRNKDGTTTKFKKSIRNMAEIETRFNLIVDDLKDKGLEINKSYVVASSHANESERCHWWSSKIFLLDLDVATRPMGQYKKGSTPTQDIVDHIDGKPVYSLKQACEQGFLSYNCQHRLVKYYKGINPPKYDMVTVNKERNLTARQRVLENRIRKYKARAEISPDKLRTKYLDPFTGKSRKMSYRRYNQLMAKYWTEKYTELSRNNNLPEYRWRTRITLTEREVRDL